jgi:hypothetical protein
MDLIISNVVSNRMNVPRVDRWWFQRGELGEKRIFARGARHSNPKLGTYVHSKATPADVMWHEMATMRKSTLSGLKTAEIRDRIRIHGRR